MLRPTDVGRIALSATVTTAAAKRTANMLSKIELAFPQILASTQRAHQIREKVRAQPCGPALDVSYDENALALNQAFFARNLFKAELAIAAFRAPLSRYHRYIDIGAGAGTASLACATEFPTLDHLIVDRSKAQIALAQTLWPIAFPGTSPMFVVADILRGGPIIPNSTDTIVITSYWLCEQRPAQFIQVAKFIRNTPVAALLIIDYSYVIRRSASVARREKVLLLDDEVNVPTCLQYFIRQDTVKVSAGFYFNG